MLCYFAFSEGNISYIHQGCRAPTFALARLSCLSCVIQNFKGFQLVSTLNGNGCDKFILLFSACTLSAQRRQKTRSSTFSRLYAQHLENLTKTLVFEQVEVQ